MGIEDFLIGSEGKIDWKQLRKLMEYDSQLNKTDRGNPFVGWAWENKLNAAGEIMYDEDGNPIKSNTQSMRINPDFQPAVTELGRRATGDSPQVQAGMSSQMQSMASGLQEQQMQRYGLPPKPPGG